MRFIYESGSSLTKEHIAKIQKPLDSYLSVLRGVIANKNYSADEASLCLPSDTGLIERVIALAKKKQSARLRYIFLIGIGGSNLGTKALYDGLVGFFDQLQPNRFPKIVFLDTQDESFLTVLQGLIQTLAGPEEFLINVISKSGGTTETVANFEILFSWLTKKFGPIHERVVCTSDFHSPLSQKAATLGFDVLELPQKVGGRYSVLSPVGLFPLRLVGVDIHRLCDGAVKMRDICVNSPSDENPAVISASFIYSYALVGKTIHDTFLFAPQLESLGKWYRQLMGESIGKNEKGVTPTVSIGSVDHHSVVQLYLGGPRDKTTTFVSVEKPTTQISIPPAMTLNLVAQIGGSSVFDVLGAIVEGTKIAYRKNGNPFVEVVFEAINETELGAFIQFKMVEMMCLGKLFEVNPFDQPHVELYKKETKTILESKKQS